MKRQHVKVFYGSSGTTMALESSIEKWLKENPNQVIEQISTATSMAMDGYEMATILYHSFAYHVDEDSELGKE